MNNKKSNEKQVQANSKIIVIVDFGKMLSHNFKNAIKSS